MFTIKTLTSTLILITLSLILTSCGTSEIKVEDIESITLTVGGPGQEEHTVINFSDPDTFKHFFSIEKKLDRYDPQKYRIETWKIDVKIQYHLIGGETITREYKGISSVEEYLKEIYNSREYKEQIVPLFKLDKGEIKNVRLDTKMTVSGFFCRTMSKIF